MNRPMKKHKYISRDAYLNWKAEGISDLVIVAIVAGVPLYSVSDVSITYRNTYTHIAWWTELSGE